ncbi:hypothetical protein DFH05DRAFT_580966 [Lentinula detonsa]|uniref:AAA+ ATPase domain-containing protein n=1 Tax=Lentinula detonsa TaxID=2804962 RepID=A0A9W8U1D9_9AGAR|nr:hypothetical protein DFH05DRAFT_580966 [Lentinula detonsa]
MNGKGSFSATDLARYHHYNCELFIYNTYNGVENPRAHIDQAHDSPTMLDAAQFKRGNDWEAHLLTWLDEENLLLTVPSHPLKGEDFVENVLADERDHFFVSGISIMPPQEHFDEMYRKAGLEPVKFGLAKPDLIEVVRSQDGVMWKVIDAKASRAVKTSHHVQIYFYTLCLNHLLPQSFFRASNAAAVWLPPEDGFDTNPPSLDDLKTVETSLLSFPLDDFLFRRLPAILSLPRKDVFWHYNPLCHGCPYSRDCQQKTIDQGEIGSISNISIPEAKLLRSLLQIWQEFSGISMTHRRGETDIEDLALLLEDSKGTLQRISSSYPVTLRKAKRILALPPGTKKLSKLAASSPLLQAARTGKIQVIPRRNSTCPKSEDIAVVLSLLLDPSAPSGASNIVSFSISTFTSDSVFNGKIPRNIHGDRTDLIPSLAYIIDSILLLTATFQNPPRTQFYVFSSAEDSALQTHFVDAALNSSYPTRDIRVCIGALSQGAALLQTTFQPLLLSGVLLDFLTKGRRNKHDFQGILERMDMSIEGNIQELKQRIQNELQRLQKDDSRQAAQQQRQDELGQLPRVVVLKREIEKSLALPIPGFWDLQECASVLLSPRIAPETHCPSEEEIYSVFARENSPSTLLTKRNEAIYAVLVSLRQHVSGVNNYLLVNEAKVLTSTFMDICREEHLRKLFYMQQFEVLTRLSDLWRSRIDGCPEAPILQYHSTHQGSKRLEHTFFLLSGDLDMVASDNDKTFFDYLLVEDRDYDDTTQSGAHIPIEALFDDLAVSNLVFPLNKYTKSRWQSQNLIVQKDLLLADVRDISVDGLRTRVTLQTWGEATFKFSEECTYRISPRLVDFNISKVLSALFELDLQHELEGVSVPFIQIIRNPKLFNQENVSPQARKMLEKAGNEMQNLFCMLDGLDVEAAKPLVLKASQNRAAKHILSNRLSVIWGPPGTGKTHTIALSLLRLFSAYANAPNQVDVLSPRVVFVTAVTHAAIDAVLKKLTYLVECYKSINSLPTEWLDKVSIEHVTNGNDHAAPSGSSAFSLYAGTIFQLYNFSKRYSISVDCIVIDEAGQLALSSAALVLRSLKLSSRIVIAGDSEQLSPILVAKYPQLKTGPLFGSILDTLMYVSRPGQAGSSDTRSSSPFPDDASDGAASSQSTIVQLTENFRLNPDLGEFVSTIYSKAFRPQKVQARRIALALSSIPQSKNSQATGEYLKILDFAQRFLLGLSHIMLKRPQRDLSPPLLSNLKEHTHSNDLYSSDVAPHPLSLALIQLSTISRKHRDNVGYELHVKAEAAVTAALIAVIQEYLPGEDIFVATPHRIQRQAVRAALLARHFETLSEMFDEMTLDGGKKKSTVTVDTVERLQGSEAAFVICLFSLPQSHITDLQFLLERRRLNVAISRAKSMCILISSNEVLRPAVGVLTDGETAKGYTFLRAFADRAWSSNVSVDIDALNL